MTTTRSNIYTKLLITFLYLFSSSIAWANSSLDQQLRDAASGGTTEQVSDLIRQGAKIDAPGKFGKRPLMFAAEAGDAGIVAVLLSYGAEVNARTKSGSSALTLAAENGHAQVTALLIELGANVHDRTRAGRDPLMISAKRGDHIIVAQLLKFGADVRSSDRKGNSALMHAIKAGHSEVVKTLFRYSDRLAPCVPNNAGLTPLMVAINKKQHEVINILLTKIKNVNFQDNFGASALHYAATTGNHEIIQYLVEQRQADINLQDQEGSTPLIEAVKAGHTKAVSQLLTNGADKNLKNSTGKTAQQFAQENNKPAILKLLLTR